MGAASGFPGVPELASYKNAAPPPPEARSQHASHHASSSPERDNNESDGDVPEPWPSNQPPKAEDFPLLLQRHKSLKMAVTRYRRRLFQLHEEASTLGKKEAHILEDLRATAVSVLKQDSQMENTIAGLEADKAVLYEDWERVDREGEIASTRHAETIAWRDDCDQRVRGLMDHIVLILNRAGSMTPEQAEETIKVITSNSEERRALATSYFESLEAQLKVAREENRKLATTHSNAQVTTNKINDTLWRKQQESLMQMFKDNSANERPVAPEHPPAPKLPASWFKIPTPDLSVGGSGGGCDGCCGGGCGGSSGCGDSGGCGCSGCGGCGSGGCGGYCNDSESGGCCEGLGGTSASARDMDFGDSSSSGDPVGSGRISSLAPPPPPMAEVSAASACLPLRSRVQPPPRMDAAATPEPEPEASASMSSSSSSACPPARPSRGGIAMSSECAARAAASRAAKGAHAAAVAASASAAAALKAMAAEKASSGRTSPGRGVGHSSPSRGRASPQRGGASSPRRGAGLLGGGGSRCGSPGPRQRGPAQAPPLPRHRVVSPAPCPSVRSRGALGVGESPSSAGGTITGARTMARSTSSSGAASAVGSSQRAPPVLCGESQVSELRLRELLFEVNFRQPVQRLRSKPNTYSFGPDVEAVLKLDNDGDQMLASRDGGGTFEPLETFLKELTRRSDSVASSPGLSDSACRAASCSVAAERVSREGNLRAYSAPASTGTTTGGEASQCQVRLSSLEASQCRGARRLIAASADSAGRVGGYSPPPAATSVAASPGSCLESPRVAFRDIGRAPAVTSSGSALARGGLHFAVGTQCGLHGNQYPASGPILPLTQGPLLPQQLQLRQLQRLSPVPGRTSPGPVGEGRVARLSAPAGTPAPAASPSPASLRASSGSPSYSAPVSARTFGTGSLQLTVGGGGPSAPPHGMTFQPQGAYPRPLSPVPHAGVGPLLPQVQFHSHPGAHAASPYTRTVLLPQSARRD